MSERFCTAGFMVSTLVVLALACTPPRPADRSRPAARPPAARPTASLTLSAVRGSFRTRPTESTDRISPIWNDSTNRITLSAARGETIGFFLIIRSTTAVDDIGVTCTPQVRDSLACSIARVAEVQVDTISGWQVKCLATAARLTRVTDALIPASAPRGGLPARCTAEDPLVLWIDIGVPVTARPGPYRAEIEVTIGGRSTATATLQLGVHPFVLAPAADVTLLAPVDVRKLFGHHLRFEGVPFFPDRLIIGDPLYAEASGLLHATLRTLYEHRVDPIIRGIYPIIERDEQDPEEITVDWADYDRIIGRVLDGRLSPTQPPVRLWPIPFDEWFPTPPRGEDPLGSPRHNGLLRQYLAGTTEHFRDKTWLPKAVIVLPVENPTSPAMTRRIKDYATLIDMVGSAAPVVARMPPQNLRPYGWQDYPYVDLQGYVDVWCPTAQFFDPAVFDQARFRKQRRWFALDRPPFSGSLEPNAPDTFVRVIPWQAARLDAEAVVLPVANDWAGDFARDDLAAQYAQIDPPLILPGRIYGLDRPIPTLRLKMLRRGMQDLDHLALCADMNQNRLAELVPQALCRAAGAEAYGAHCNDGMFDAWEYDPTWWNHAVDLLAEHLAELVAVPDDQREDRLDTLQWKRFIGSTMQIDILPGGCVVRPLSSPDTATGYEVTALVNIRNRTAEAITGVLRIADLPLGWTTDAPVSIELLEPFQTRKVALVLRTAALSTDAGGKLRLPLALDVTGGSTVEQSLTLSHLAIQKLRKRIDIDGEFDDWPVGVGNMARFFVPIDRAQTDTGTQVDQSFVLGATDRTHLYFAIHCFTSDDTPLPDTLTNFVHYSDGIPIGEELFEILIDPSNNRASVPSDIYHIVLKPSGVALTERGVHAGLPIGPRDTWPADIQVATRRRAGRWVAEVSIPLKAFGPLADTTSTWGVNFTHTRGHQREYTNWAEARWNVYNPTTLGNMSFSH